MAAEDKWTATVDVAMQTLTVTHAGEVVRVYRVSTAKAGIGSEAGSGKTPPGRHRIARLFGHRAEPGQVFVSRRAVPGEIIPQAHWRGEGAKDYVLTRILWLEGLEPGINAGPGCDSRARYIYIHGTNQEQLLGTPVSHGCIRMANADVIDFFNLVKRHRDFVVNVQPGGAAARTTCVVPIVPHGFCSGVANAVKKAEAALAKGGTTYCLHDLVHNENVVARMQALGLRFVASLDEVPAGARVLLSAHGTGPEVRREAERRGLEIVDATCPFVARVHRQVRAYAERGLPVVVVGHARHVEVEGVVAEARDAGAQVAVVASPGEVAALPFPPGGAIGVVCQTTLSGEMVAEMMAALRQRHPGFETTPSADVCTATRDRQEAVRAFVAQGGDGVLVLGSAASSNTRRLVEIAEAAGAKAWRAANEAELGEIDFGGVRRLGVTSGASTPEDFLDQVLIALKNRL